MSYYKKTYRDFRDITFFYGNIYYLILIIASIFYLIIHIYMYIQEN